MPVRDEWESGSERERDVELDAEALSQQCQIDALHARIHDLDPDDPILAVDVHVQVVVQLDRPASRRLGLVNQEGIQDIGVGVVRLQRHAEPFTGATR